jgi:hypothetical protein
VADDDDVDMKLFLTVADGVSRVEVDFDMRPRIKRPLRVECLPHGERFLACRSEVVSGFDGNELFPGQYGRE